MPSQYASVESAAEAAIRFLCAHKHIEVGNVNYNLKFQVERKFAASDTYKRLHQFKKWLKQPRRNEKALCQAYRDLLQRHIIFMILEVHMQN
jgi:hypothetical protein